MNTVNKNPFERFTQKGAASALWMCLLLAGCFASCSISEDNVEDENHPVYVWTEGQKYYYAFYEKIFLVEVSNKIVLTFDESYLSDIQQYLQKISKILHMELANFDRSYILTTVENSNVRALMEDLKKQAGVKSVNQMYWLLNDMDWVYGGTEMGVTDEIVVQFKENTSQQKIDEIYKKYRLEILNVNELFQVLSVPIDFDPLEVANAIQTSGLTNFCCPNFLVEVSFFTSSANYEQPQERYYYAFNFLNFNLK